MSFYALTATTLSGKVAALSAYAGKVALVVNVASECGFTPQYEGLQKLSTEYADKGLVVLGFPTNEFGGQEPGSSEQIASFCKLNYGVTFPMFAKVEVKPGASQSEVYRFLTSPPPMGGGNVPAWNFAKFLVGKDGMVRGFFPSKIAPDSPVLREAIDTALAEGALAE